MLRSYSLGMITKSTHPVFKNGTNSSTGHASIQRSDIGNTVLLGSQSSHNILLTSASPRDSLGVVPSFVYDTIDAGTAMPSSERDMRDSIVSADNKPDLADYELTFVLDLDEADDEEEVLPTLRRY